MLQQLVTYLRGQRIDTLSYKKTLITTMVMLSLTTIVPGDSVMVFVLTPFN